MGVSHSHAVIAVVLMFVLQVCGCRPSKADLVDFGLGGTSANTCKITILESDKELILTGKELRKIVDALVSKNLEPLASSLSGKKLAEISFYWDDVPRTTITYFEGSVALELHHGRPIFVKLKQDPFLRLLNSGAD